MMRRSGKEIPAARLAGSSPVVLADNVIAMLGSSRLLSFREEW
jgi:hypothetical protein